MVCPLFCVSTDSEYIRDLIRRGQERSTEAEALIEGEASGEAKSFDAGEFKQKMLASHG